MPRRRARHCSGSSPRSTCSTSTTSGSPLADQTKRDLLEILDDRYDKKSTLITSQLPVDQWYTYIDEPTLADAILDRLVHNSHRVNLKGGSMRKRKSTTAVVAPP